MNTMAQARMPEKFRKPYHQLERERLQRHLIDIDRDTNELQALLAQLYTGHPQNPHMLYTVATHLTALTHLDRRDSSKQPTLPESHQAERAFTTYTRLINMLNFERNTPLYAHNPRIRRRLAGAREELAFHAVLGYATMQGADFVALPAPAELDFDGAHEASDIHVYFPESETPLMELQITTQPARKAEKAYPYHPRIPVMSLAGALGSARKAQKLRNLLANIGGLDDGPHQDLAGQQHDLLLSSAAAILRTAKEWKSAPLGNRTSSVA